MPKGQKRSAQAKLADVRAQIAALKEDALKLEPQAKSEDVKHAARQAFLIGETILKADLSRDEKRTISRILDRREKKPGDWSKISAFIIAAHPPVPTIEPAVDFVATPTRPIGEGFDQVAES